jgi:cellulose synthase/poly-beta-1,6-N-acetylglucosamine synthase-like glycosyltransferase
LTLLLAPVVRVAAYSGPKRISAMMRVKDEEEFVRASACSIIDVVDELVIIDNNSSDATPDIIAALVAEYPGKVRSLRYPHVVARYGDENRELAATREGRRSPRLLANFYNWSMAQCTYEFILKWDGDTIATDAFRKAVADFRVSPKQALWVTGLNLHADGMHLVRGIPREPLEPRLVYRRFARYTNYMGYCEGLESPYIRRFMQYSEFVDQPSYLHMKYRKRNRYVHMSANLQQMVVDYRADEPGEAIDPDQLTEVEAILSSSGSNRG